jgi:uncharacterized surface protein with fasciclin (FAS1) repeats
LKRARGTALALALGAALSAGGGPVLCGAELSVEVGGAPMVASKSIVENLAVSKDHTVLVRAIESAGFAEVLQGEGPLTFFAPVDKAFEKQGADAANLEPGAEEKLRALLATHVVPGRFSAADLVVAAEKAGGKAKLVTLAGSEIVVTHDGRKLAVLDAEGGKAVVTIPDIVQKNGIVHVVDKVLQPRE